jgi:serine/threonine protein kinase
VRPADLNPNNVLLKRDRSAAAGVICKVADFGLSVLMPDKDATHVSNLCQGTPFYTAPEVAIQVHGCMLGALEAAAAVQPVMAQGAAAQQGAAVPKG